MSYRRVPVFVAATAAIVAIPSLVIGQPRNIGPRPPWSDSTPTRIMASAGKGFPSDVVVEVLRQRHQSYSNAKRRELGELAATRAITEPRVGTPAITALSMSGSPDPGLGGVPNLGALDLLIRIHGSATARDARHLAVSLLVDQVNPARALPYLRQLATSTNSDDASDGVSEIGRLAYGMPRSQPGPSERKQAEALLRELYDKNLVKPERAARAMCEAALDHKWPPVARCRGPIN